MKILIINVLMLLVLVGCGGGESSTSSNLDMTTTSSVQTGHLLSSLSSSANSTSISISISTSSDITWTPCATENGQCSFSGQAQVKYGSATQYVIKTFTGSVACNNSIFGDPAVGTVKSCSYYIAPATVPTAITWTPCASEDGQCNFTGLREVRYGTATNFVTKEMNNGGSCSNGIFGDPAVGIVKSCSYSSVVWTQCASENGQCSFTATSQVRYGTLTNYVTKQLTNGTPCSNDVFGDPVFGFAKTCWFLPQTVTADPCQILPALPTLPTLTTSYNTITSFCNSSGHCVTPNDGMDDTDIIDTALDQSAGKFLVFPPGKYIISRSLRIKQSGVTLWGPGATIHATNNDDQSIIVEGNNNSIYSFRLTAVTKERGGRAEDSRIAIYGPAGVNPVVKNTIIRNNQIVTDTGLPNSATGTGIFINAADGFLIAGNTINRTLADGIHMTGGSKNGRVIGNTVSETGDDMIAMVSYAYADPNINTAASIAPSFTTNVNTYEDDNILVYNNTLSAQYWGRGISVVGGKDITIRGNTLNNIPYAAAIYLSRETQSGTYGVNNILVENNSIKDEQTLNPTYDFENKFASNSRTQHGAFEINSALFNDELAYPALVDGFSVKNIEIRNNNVTSSATPAARIGVGTGSNWSMGSKSVTGTAPSLISLDTNTLADIRVSPSVLILTNSSQTASCNQNTLDGKASTNPLCLASSTSNSSIAVTGANESKLVCTGS